MNQATNGRSLIHAEGFTSARFRGMLKGGSIRNVPGGDWEIKFVIPRDEAADIIELVKALGIPLNINLTKWHRHD